MRSSLSRSTCKYFFLRWFLVPFPQEDLHPCTQEFSMTDEHSEEAIITLCTRVSQRRDQRHSTGMVGNSEQPILATTARETQKPELSQKQIQINCKHFSKLHYKMCYYSWNKKICRWTKLFSITNTVMARNLPHCSSKEQRALTPFKSTQLQTKGRFRHRKNKIENK